jgi:flavodoxin I
MATIGLFYGSDSGSTESVAGKIEALLGKEQVQTHDVGHAEVTELEEYQYLILGIPTYDEGELQSDWGVFLEDILAVNFANKKVALFGLGDQLGYGEWYLDAMGILHDKLVALGATIVGHWPSEGYEYEASKAIAADGQHFVGLALDEDTQAELTDERLERWTQQIKQEFGIAC